MAEEEHEFTGTLVPLPPCMLLSAHAGWRQAELRSIQLLLTSLLLPQGVVGLLWGQHLLESPDGNPAFP